MSLIDATYPQTYFVKVSISSRIFENVPQKGLEYSHRTGDCGENLKFLLPAFFFFLFTFALHL